MTEKYVCIHGHFYQPPRENPWLEKVEAQDSAYPYHDWNQKITAQCYAPNSVARIMDPSGEIIGLVNNYSQISFNFGPTLLYWLAQNAPEVYQAILDADKQSMGNYSGHGSAIAQAYNHMIMPLANKRDKETQVQWAVKGFTSRNKRAPEGMWLPETAVDTETLELLAKNNIKFTIFSPHQAKRIRKLNAGDWTDVTGGRIDPRRAYLCKLPSGRSISLFFYDKRVSTDAAFGNLLSNGEALANRLIEAFNDSQDPASIVSIASDGELYGHHHAHGDMTLAYCLYYIKANNLAKVTNYGLFLEKYPPQYEVEIIENTSWSCSHGVERWRSDCGDNSGMHPGWNQAWRKPLREALDWLRDTLIPKFEQAAQEYYKDPWEARNNYVYVVVDRSQENIEAFLAKYAKKSLGLDEKRKALKLLEMQREAMLMYTSCGWFFDEISGIETVQVLAYAARAIQLARDLFGEDLEEQFINMLSKAPSNIPEFGSGAYVYNIFVKPQEADLKKMAAQHAIMWLFQMQNMPPSNLTARYCCFKETDEHMEVHEVGNFRLAVGNIKVKSNVTLDESSFSCTAVWLGDHNISCGIVQEMPSDVFNAMQAEITENFKKGQMNETIQLLPKYFAGSSYSLKDLFRDDQLRILALITQNAVKRAIDLNRIVYRDNVALLRFMQGIRIPQPRPFRDAAENVLNQQLNDLLSAQELDIAAFEKTVSDVKQLGANIDKELIGLEASQKIADELQKIASNPQDAKRIEDTRKLVESLNELSVNINLWSAQNIAFNIAQQHYKPAKEKNDIQAQSWLTAFEHLSASMKIKLS